MLKIKDNVNLDDLEKYGFIKKYYVDEWCYVKTFNKGFTYNEKLIIWRKDRNIQSKCTELLSTLYDLIKDGLVEKINE